VPDAAAAPTWSRRKLAVLLSTAVAVGLLDHLTKWLVTRSLAYGEEWPHGGFVTIHHTENAGAAFGLFPQFTQLYLIVAVAVAVYILIIGPRMSGGLFRQVVLGCILGGAVSNGIDRAVAGHVTDFIDFHFWPVFNVADMAIVGGILFAVVFMMGRGGDRSPAPAGREP
jgi:signal peptidase II